MNDDLDDEHSPHLNTAEDPYLARRATAAETERTRQLRALEAAAQSPRARARARALARARRDRQATTEGTDQ